MNSILGPFSSVQFCHSVMSNSVRPHGLQHTRPPCPSPTSRVSSNSCPVSDAIQPSNPLLSPYPPAFNLSQHQGLLKWVSYSHHVAKVLEFHHQSFQWISGLISFRMDWLDLLVVHGTLKNLLQTPQFKSINSSVLSFLFMFLQTFIHVLFSPDTWIHYHMSKT